MKYFKEIEWLFSKIATADNKSNALPMEPAINKITKTVISRVKNGAKVIFIGNGGSASIASHMAVDFLKNGGIPALAFNDSSLLTCISNDLGYEYVFQKPLEVLAKKNDVLFTISSSGKSKNILNGTQAAKKKGCFIITFSGFKKNNPLRQLGDINFYVPSHSYGYVEISHLAICHCIVDKIIADKKNG